MSKHYVIEGYGDCLTYRDVLDRLLTNAHNIVVRGDSSDFVLREIDQAEAAIRAISSLKDTNGVKK